MTRLCCLVALVMVALRSPVIAERPPEAIASRLYNLSGRSEQGAAVQLLVGGTLRATQKAGADGAFQFKDVRLTEGLNTLTIVVTDAAGNSQQARKRVWVDTTPPDWQFVEPASGLRTKDRSLSVIGKTEPGARVVLAVNDTERPAVTVGETGEFRAEVTGLPFGPNRFHIRAADALGNATEATVTVFVKAPPELGVEGKWDGPFTEPAVVIEGVSEPGARVALTLDGAVWGTPVTVDKSGRYRFALKDLAEGKHVATVTATDGVGNEVRRQVRFTIAIPQPPPPAPLVIAQPREGAVSETPWVVVTGTSEPGTAVSLRLRGTPVAKSTSDDRGQFRFPRLQLPRGVSELSVSATPREGVEQHAAVSVRTAMPVLRPSLVAPALRADGSVTGTRTDLLVTGRAGCQVMLRVNTVPRGSGLLDAKGKQTFLAVPLDPGLNNITATLTDGESRPVQLQLKVIAGR